MLGDEVRAVVGEVHALLQGMVGDRFRVTLVARYVGEEPLDDASWIVSGDPDLAAAADVVRRFLAPRPGDSITELGSEGGAP